MTLKFTEDHEWINVEGDTATVGITDHAQDQLGDIVFIELPETGTALDMADEAGAVESVKAASEIYAPVSGEVTEVNAALEDNPGVVNSDPMGDGWFFKLKLGTPDELDTLMDEDQYKTYLEGLDG